MAHWDVLWPRILLHFPAYAAHGPLISLEDTVFLIWTEGPLDLVLGEPPNEEGRP
jgi:hypothetical protein